jgi:hypothetical protein
MPEPTPERHSPELLAHALRDPAAVFPRPSAVLTAPDLSTEERRAILEQWELDARRLEASAGEGMGGGEQPLLTEVRAALRELSGAG